MKFLRLAFICSALFIAVLPVWPQALPDGNQSEELFYFVGLRLDDLIARFGIPQAVHAVRGNEYWQDDVVFVYSEGDFYIYRDRVWQIGLRSVFGFRIGDAKALAMLVLGDKAQDRGDFILFPIPGGYWPLSLRISVSEGRISGIFVYRSDF